MQHASGACDHVGLNPMCDKVPPSRAIIFVHLFMRESHTNNHHELSIIAQAGESWPDTFLIFLWVPLDDAYARAVAYGESQRWVL